jgi:hypothetical protein
MNIQSTVKSLDFTGNDDHVIKTKQPERVAPHRPEYLEQNRGLSMNDFSTPAKSGVVQFVDVHDLIRSKTPLEAAEIALRLGLRPIPLAAAGERLGKKQAGGKEPLGARWQSKSWTPESLRTIYAAPGRGCGLQLGPAGNLIDIEIDRPAGAGPEYDEAALNELTELLGGELPETAGWESARGRHYLFQWHEDLAAAKIAVVKIGRLEIRLGAGAAAQSAIPPTGGRRWLPGVSVVQPLPPAAVAAILAAKSGKPLPKITVPSKRDETEKRLRGQCLKLADQIRSAPELHRHNTARNLVRTMAGHTAAAGRADLIDEFKATLTAAYAEAQSELRPDDYEIKRTIADGWANGWASPLPLENRPLNGQAQAETAIKPPVVIKPAADLATIRRHCSEREYFWRWWIAKRALTLIDGKPGVGKSRFILELLRRVVCALQWPDATNQTMPPETRFLWLAADGNFDQIVEVATEFELPDTSIIFPGCEDHPFDHTDLTAAATLQIIEARVEKYRPAAVVIDTATSALGSVQQNDRTGIAAIARWLNDLARRYDTAIILIGHQNKAGGSYGDAWPAVVDSRITLETDGQEIRVELTNKARWNYLKAPILHGKQADSGWEFKVEPRDLESVATPASGNATDQVKAAILEYVTRYPETRKSNAAARMIEYGYSKSTCYRAIDELLATDQIVEFEKDFGKFKAGCLILGPPDTVSDSQKSIP